ncbi:hypothetical protein V6S67_13120 [Arthrobacter sp. Soc17.1.1.1]|uniref:hypothetical protein n=1 Tax=Arthrobacter sp. Soc17.1.1.1 TaxID=3121277 RepID=UPI002FE4943E
MIVPLRRSVGPLRASSASVVESHRTSVAASSPAFPALGWSAIPRSPTWGLRPGAAPASASGPGPGPGPDGHDLTTPVRRG